jgi:hypothetical protein
MFIPCILWTLGSEKLRGVKKKKKKNKILYFIFFFGFNMFTMSIILSSIECSRSFYRWDTDLIQNWSKSGSQAPKLKVSIDELQLASTSLKIQTMVTVDASTDSADGKLF